MNEALIHFIQSPERVLKENSTFLQDLLHEFPYFQTAHLLYVKYLQGTASADFDKQLKTAAAYAGNRKVLYQLLLKKDAPEEERSQPLPPQEDHAALIDNLQLMAEPKEDPAEVLPVVPEIPAGQAAAVPGSPAEEEKTAAVREVPSYPLDMEILQEAANASFERQISSAAEQSFTSPVPHPEPLKAEQETKQIDKLHEKHSFADWLNRLKQQETAQADAGPTAERPGETSAPVAGEVPVGKKQYSELIDKFIATEPKISSPGKAEFFSPINMARQSVTEDTSFITETLAKIYVKQGNYAKAIKAYQKLSLKYPEKKLYFADQIKSIEAIIKNK